MSKISDKNNGFLKTFFSSYEKDNKLLRFSLTMAGFSIIVALIIPAVISKNSYFLVYNNPGIDYDSTKSIKKTKRYHIRKSIINIQ